MAQVATRVRAAGPERRPPGGKTPRLTPAERAAVGKRARVRVPRESHATFDRPPDRAQPVDLLEGQSESRIRELVPVRYGRMLVSPFSYFRGAALPMANDLAATPATGIYVQACGDAHLANFGLFASPERKLAFDLNDFDETLPAPWEWDVKRLAASLEVAGRENGYPAKMRRAIVRSALARYRQAMRDFAGMRNLDVWYTQADALELRERVAPALRAWQRKVVDKGLAKAPTRDSMQAVRKLTRLVNGEPRIIPDPPLIIPLSELVPGEMERAGFEAGLEDLVDAYRQTVEADRRVLLEQYTYADMARKVVGVGSVGTRCWIVLFLGRDDRDPLLLQVKEAQESVLAGFAGPSRQENQGQRVVVGQRMLQAVSDIFLGWLQAPGLDGRLHDFYIRQLRDWKFSYTIETMAPSGLRAYGEVCGWTLARAHARSGDRIAIASYLGGSDAFDRAIAEFARVYADQNERDHAALAAAVRSGRITAARG